MLHRIHPMLLCLAAAVPLFWPGNAPAYDCEHYMLCCHGYHTALVEAGFPPDQLQAMANICEVPNMPRGIGFNAEQWCVMSWYTMGDYAWDHFMSGQAAFYPDSCPDRGDDDVMDPDPMDPDPEDEPGEI